MGLIFDEKYFTDTGYPSYKNFPHFRARAGWIEDNLTGSILEIGCAAGYLIDELDFLGIIIEGIDKSPYIVGQAPVSIADRVTLGDIADLSVLFPSQFDWIVSWNVLDCLIDDVNAQQVCNQLNSLGKNQLHVIATDGDHFIAQGYFIQNYAYWRNLLPNAHLIEEMGFVHSSLAFSKVPLSYGRVSL